MKHWFDLLCHTGSCGLATCCCDTTAIQSWRELSLQLWYFQGGKDNMITCCRVSQPSSQLVSSGFWPVDLAIGVCGLVFLFIPTTPLGLTTLLIFSFPYESILLALGAMLCTSFSLLCSQFYNLLRWFFLSYNLLSLLFINYNLLSLCNSQCK